MTAELCDSDRTAAVLDPVRPDKAASLRRPDVYTRRGLPDAAVHAAANLQVPFCGGAGGDTVCRVRLLYPAVANPGAASIFPL